MRLVVKVIVLIFILNSAAFGQCGGKFSQFLDDIKNEALKLGHTELKIEAFLQGVALNPKVLEADRAQAIFLKPFNECVNIISPKSYVPFINRIDCLIIFKSYI